MTLFKRFGFYFIGLSIGLVFLAFFFKEKKTEFCYLPNCRVLKELKNKPLIISEEALPVFKTDSFMSSYLDSLFVKGTILFSESDVNKKPCKSYVLKDLILECTILSCDSSTVVKKIAMIKK